MVTRPTEVSQLALLARGDLAALGAFFQLHGAAVRRFVRASRVASFEVDDVVQQVFLDVPRAARRFDHSAQTPVRQWLLGIARIAVLRHGRMAARRAAKQAELAVDPSLRQPNTDLGGVLESRDGAKRALGALCRISPKKRQVFELVVLADASGAEVARTLGVPVATVWTRLHHARRDLKRLLHPCDR